MKPPFGGRLRKALKLAVGWFGLLAVLGLGLAYSGLYSVAASQGHPAWLDWFLNMGMRRSVTMHSANLKSPPLDSMDLIRLGASHFELGCAGCHGAPGKPGNPVFAGMLPSPPDLTVHVRTWDNAELFWIVSHGIQYAGMPAWSGRGRDDEVWALVAFMRTLVDLDAGAYAALARGNVAVLPVGAPTLERSDAALLAATSCARCHETPDAAPTSALVPKLGGQTRQYLAEALRRYRDGSRQSGFMEPAAAGLSDAQISALAVFYSELDAPVSVLEPVEDQRIERGRRLARRGDPEARLPACDACHGVGALPLYPRLAGQSARYMVRQLELWREGRRSETPLSQIMATIGRRLDAAQIIDVAAYYQQQSVFDAPGEAGPRTAEEP